MDGGWNEWTEWSECSSHCGEGKSFRRRQCSNPEPRSGGADCEGSAVEEGDCFDHSCANISEQRFSIISIIINRHDYMGKDYIGVHKCSQVSGLSSYLKQYDHLSLFFIFYIYPKNG